MVVSIARAPGTSLAHSMYVCSECLILRESVIYAVILLIAFSEAAVIDDGHILETKAGDWV